MSTSGGAESPIATLARQIQSALREGRIADAAQLTERLRAQAPDDPNTELFSGIIAYKLGRFLPAIAHFENLRSRHPSNTTTLFWLGNALRHEGRLDEAVETYRAVLERAPSDDARANLESTENLRRIESIGRHALADDRRLPSPTTLQTLIDRAADLARNGIGAPTHERVPHVANGPLISVVVCTITPAKLQRLRASLDAALDGVRWELISITDARSLCEGFTRGFARTRGELIVFCHDDIEILCEHFADRLLDACAGTDMVGVAGTTLLNGPALGWAGAPHMHGAVTHVDGGALFPSLFSSAGPRVDGAHALDGLFIATRRDVVERIGFDAATFDGFDFYDVDFSYRAYKAGLRLRIQTDLHVLHASRGKFGARYAFYSERFRAKHVEFTDPPPIRRAALHQTRLESAADARRFYAWIGHWLRGAA